MAWRASSWRATAARPIADVKAYEAYLQAHPAIWTFDDVEPSSADVCVFLAYAYLLAESPIAQYFFLATLAETEDAPATLVAAEDLALRFPETVFGAIARNYAAVGRGRMTPSDVWSRPRCALTRRGAMRLHGRWPSCWHEPAQ